MCYLSLPTGVGLRIDQTPLTLHENCLRAFTGFGVMLVAISMYREGWAYR